MQKVTETFELYGKEYTLETGELAKQAGGAVVVRQGDTVVLVTATASAEAQGPPGLLPADRRLRRAHVRRRQTARRLHQARGPSHREGHAHRTHDRPPAPLGIRRRLPQRGPDHRDGPQRRPGPPARHHLHHGRIGSTHDRGHPVRGSARPACASPASTASSSSTRPSTSSRSPTSTCSSPAHATPSTWSRPAPTRSARRTCSPRSSSPWRRSASSATRRSASSPSAT